MQQCQTINELIGQEEVKTLLVHLLTTEKIPSAILFHGPYGIGKKTIAKAFVREFFHDPSLKTADFISVSIKQGEKTYKKEDLDQIRESAAFGPHEKKRKFYLLEDLHLMMDVHQNFLLKTLEELRADVTFLLTTDHIHLIPKTVVSRCLLVPLKRYSHAEIAKFLERSNVQQNETLISLAEGSLGAAGEYHSPAFLQCKYFLDEIKVHCSHGDYCDFYRYLDELKVFFDEHTEKKEALFHFCLLYLQQDRSDLFYEVAKEAIQAKNLGSSIKNIFEMVFFSLQNHIQMKKNMVR